ncbi:hypothetical protein IJJ02_02665 [Candidatus Saccharibacteria bacterium]|nr:hypothetical protein [Candidatus Saccharibacteria bacterium]
MTEDKKVSVDAQAPKKKLNRGGRNLIILGVAAVLIAAITSGVSLVIYHNSGDIYLDRSRPGFLPDEEEIEEETEDEEEYSFSKTGPIDLTVLEEYLNELQVEVEAVDAYEKPFEEKILSDESFGIPKAE